MLSFLALRNSKDKGDIIMEMLYKIFYFWRLKVYFMSWSTQSFKCLNVLYNFSRQLQTFTKLNVGNTLYFRKKMFLNWLGVKENVPWIRGNTSKFSYTY